MPLALLSVLLCFLTAACAYQIGPRALPPARFDYNEAIARSWNEQLLLNLVRLRYRDTIQFLEVSTVLTQYSLGAGASASPVINVDGSDENEFGFGASLSYAETPTITYTPLQGEDFSRRLLTPLTPETILLLSQSGWSLERLMLCCVQEVNGVSNLPSAAGPTPEYLKESRAFKRVSGLLRELQQGGALHVHTLAEKGGALRLSLERGRSPALDARIRELAGLLQLNPALGDYRVTSWRASNDPDAIAIRGRSMLSVLFFLSQTVEAPEEHRRKGKVTTTLDERGAPLDWTAATGNIMRVSSGFGSPKEAYVKVRYRRHWFYIDDADLSSKSTFWLLTELMSLQSAHQTGRGPLLTLPAGR